MACERAYLPMGREERAGAERRQKWSTVAGPEITWQMVGLRPPVGTWVCSENCPLLPYRLRTPHHTPLYEQTTGLPPYLNLRLLNSN
jgi:hypothetical protein